MRSTRTGVLVTGALLAGVLVTPAAASATQHYFARHIQTTCVATPNPYTGEYLIAARTRWRMGTNPDVKNNLRSLKLQARLIATTSGSNWTRSWRTSELKNVSADGANDRTNWVTTDTMSSTQDWNVQIKLTWNRRGKPDWHHEVKWAFDESFCKTG